jgi:alpha-tubulin suppressor-like RCC1 family protein
MAVTIVTGVQYSGIWNISSQANAKAAGTWPVPNVYLYSWGKNSNSDLGLGNTTYYSSPKLVGSSSNWLNKFQLKLGL